MIILCLLHNFLPNMIVFSCMYRDIKFLSSPSIRLVIALISFHQWCCVTYPMLQMDFFKPLNGLFQEVFLIIWGKYMFIIHALKFTIICIKAKLGCIIYQHFVLLFTHCVLQDFKDTILHILRVGNECY